MDPQFTQRFLNRVRSPEPDENDHESNDRILAQAYEAIVAADYDAFGRLLTDDVELEIRGCGRMDGKWRGRREVVEASRANFSKVAEQKPVIERKISQGDSAAVLMREEGVFRQDNAPYRYRVVQWFTFARDRIRRIEEIVASE